MNVTIKNNNNAQIQINSTNSTQITRNEKNEEIPYDEILKSLQEIQRYEKDFEIEFKESATEFKSLLENAIDFATDKKNGAGLFDTLSRLKDISINVGSGIIANGIFSILSHLLS